MTSTAERCRKKNEFYQRRFRDIEPMTSNELAALRRKNAKTDQRDDGGGFDAGSGQSESFYVTEDGSPIVLVDVRSAPERSVSIIPGAISLHEFERVAPAALPSDAVVVCYCTIGYRSGMEARRLKEKYDLEGRIRNLDGIVSYTHADPLVVGGSSNSSSQEKPHLVDPVTGERSETVHIYGPTWDCIGESYQTTHFSLPILAIRSAGVGMRWVVRFSQHSFYILKQRCACSCLQQRRQDDTDTSTFSASEPKSRPMQVECRNSQFM